MTCKTPDEFYQSIKPLVRPGDVINFDSHAPWYKIHYKVAYRGIRHHQKRLFGKLGGIYGQSDTRIKGGIKYSNDGFDLGAGAGLEFELGSFGLRVEAEYFDALMSWVKTETLPGEPAMDIWF